MIVSTQFVFAMMMSFLIK